MGNVFSQFHKKFEDAVGKDLAYVYNPLAAEVEQGNQGVERDARAAVERQAEAVRKSAQQAAKQAQEAVAQSTRQQEQAAARNAAEGAAADALNKPLENADVQIGGPVNTGQSSSAASRKRRQTFGVGSSGSGVQI